MSNKIHQTMSFLDKWIQENNELVNKWKQHEGGDHNQTHLRWISSEFNSLLRKIQGVPLLADHIQLELTVVYNACLCATAQSQFTDGELLLTQATIRILQMKGEVPVASDTSLYWITVLKSLRNTAFNFYILHLLCMQWALWLATCQLKIIEEFQHCLNTFGHGVHQSSTCSHWSPLQLLYDNITELVDVRDLVLIHGELSSLFEMLCGGDGDDRRRKTRESSDILLLLMDPKKVVELLQICTLIAQGAERLSESQSSEALSSLQRASSLPAPRTLLAYIHFLSGSCLAHMSCPQMALQCYRKALETDSLCVCALYKSMLIYRQLGNMQAEIQALRLLHSTLMLPSATEPALPSSHLLSPSLLLSSQPLSSLLSVPSALSVLHNLALKCVLHGRVSEGVEHYLDLLALLHSEDMNRIRIHAEVPSLPRLPELYLEAGAALLMARRTADCIVLCDEIINTTVELLPEMLVLEEHEEMNESEIRGVNDRMAMLLWAGAAYLLQGHCHSHLKDWKQAVTHYTRGINQLVKVCFKKTGFQPQIPITDMIVTHRTDLCVLQRLKGLSLAGRGISFVQTDQLKKALRDLQLSLQTSPECVGSGLWCGEVLWRLGRRQEAASCWKKTWSLNTQSSVESLHLYLLEPQSGPLLDSTELRHRIQELGPT